MVSKRTTYIALFALLGIILSTLLHAVVEIFYIKLLFKDFDRWSLGFSWDVLLIIHGILAALLFLLGGWFGYRQGVYWWRVIYK